MNILQFKKLNSPYILILIGPPLVGKSTFVKKFKEEVSNDITVISRDQIMMDLHGDDNYQDAFKNVNQRKVNSILDEELRNANNNKLNVIVDMTNLVSKRRRSTLDYFDNDYTKIGVIFPILDWDEFIKRNEKRSNEDNKHIPEHVLKSMISSYQSIRREEGFSKVVSI